MNKRLENAMKVIAQKNCCDICTMKGICCYERRNSVHLCDDVQNITAMILETKKYGTH